MKRTLVLLAAMIGLAFTLGSLPAKAAPLLLDPAVQLTEELTTKVSSHCHWHKKCKWKNVCWWKDGYKVCKRKYVCTKWCHVHGGSYFVKPQPQMSLRLEY